MRTRRSVLAATLIMVGSVMFECDVHAQPGDDQVWSAFLAYLGQAPPLAGPRDALQGFERSLAAAGLPGDEVARRFATVRRLTSVRDDWWPLMFDRIYASDRPSFSQHPSAVLVEAVETVTPGRALDVAMGQGRNSLFLAQRGWTVTGFDVSSEGLNAARANAQEAGVKLDAQRSTIEAFAYGEAQWDLIALIYAPNIAHEGAMMTRLARALAPRGLLVVESFASDRGAPQRRPVDIDPAVLKASLGSFELLRFDDREAVSEWDPQPTRLCRVIARKR